MSLVEQYTRPRTARDRRLEWLDIDELAVTPVGRSFMDRARCGGRSAERLSDLFFPEGRGEADYRPAIEFCSRCPVRLRCLAANLHEEWGCWGGTTLGDRKEILRRLARRDTT